jgi:D-lyxose ketol-isomerase
MFKKVGWKMTKTDYERIVPIVLHAFDQAGIILTDEEKSNIEVADFGLNDIDNIGLQIVTYVNTKRVCAKELVLLPHQTCPEHKHVNTNGSLGKEETFRCRSGEVYLYVPGQHGHRLKATIPDTILTVFHEISLKPGEQFTLLPNTLHWFQAGPNGAIVSEFSTRSTDETDVFTDTRIVRKPVIE